MGGEKLGKEGGGRGEFDESKNLINIGRGKNVTIAYLRKVLLLWNK